MRTEFFSMKNFSKPVFPFEENPNFAQHESKKNTELDDRLKQVYVTSTDHIVVRYLLWILISCIYPNMLPIHAGQFAG